jgi:hypothetical protein
MLLAVCLMVMLGMLGLAVDLGRMFILKSESQTFTDASALAALNWTAPRVGSMGPMLRPRPGRSEPPGRMATTSTRYRSPP